MKSASSASSANAVLRLMSCMEGFAHDEDGAAGRADWQALALVLERELTVVTRLARERLAGVAEGVVDAVLNAELMARAEALHQRHEALSQRIASAKIAAEAELTEIGASRRRVRSVRGAYVMRPDNPGGEVRAA